MLDRFDVLVIGGGIIGAATGHALTATGYKTLLVDRGDYGSGTSSRTSRLQHCGLGYLTAASGSIAAFLSRPGHAFESFRLMRRAMQGRAEFVQAAPERAKPVTFIVPLTRENAIPRWKAWLAFRLMAASDGGKIPLDLRLLSAREAQEHPALQGMAGLDAIRGAMTFTEYQYHWPERIVVDTVMAARTMGMEARNYTEVTALHWDGSLWQATLRNDQGSRSVECRAVANCAGVWVDALTGLAGRPELRRSAGEKGTNIMVRLPDRFAGLGFETVTAKGAPFYLIPWGNLHYVGPWDSEATGAPHEFRATEAEISAILAQLNQLFPDLEMSRSAVLYSWAGVRPRSLAADGRGSAPGVREHDLTDSGLPNFFAFTGGLFMTHRDAGRRLVRAVKRRLAPSLPECVDNLVAPPLDQLHEVSEASIAHAVRAEQARTVSDILRRRLSLGWEPDLGLSRARMVADLAAPHLAWSPDETAAQLAAFVEEVRQDFGYAREG